MRLEPWDKEPANYHLLAVFAGDQRRWEQFIEEWFDWRGDLELLAAPLDDPKLLPWVDGRAAYACVISVERLAAWYLIGWWRENPDWRLFYQPAEPDEENPSVPVVATDPRPRGHYRAWGYAAGGDAGAMMVDGEAIRLWHCDKDGARTFSTALPTIVFNHLFAPPPERVARLDGPRRRDAKPAPDAGRAYPLPLRLVRELPFERPLNPKAKITRLQNEINLLTEQVESLQWWRDASDGVSWLNIYPETDDPDEPGSIWRLRDWIIRAPQRAIEQFKHQRLEVEGLKVEGTGVLHLVTALDDWQEPEYALPPPLSWLRLRQDWRWRDKSRSLFVTEKWQLWPPPPKKNLPIEDLLVGELWGKGEPKPALFLLRDPSGAEHRFTAPWDDFKPLGEQFKQLNFQFAVKQAQAAQHNAGDRHVMELLALLQFGNPLANGLLEQLRIDVNQQLRARAVRIKDVLDKVWSGPRADLNLYEQQVSQALEQTRLIHQWRNEIAQFGDSGWKGWEDFRDEVLRLDHQLVEATGHSSKDDLHTLDLLRHQLAQLWQNDTEKNRDSLARSLRELAKKIETGTL